MTTSSWSTRVHSSRVFMACGTSTPLPSSACMPLHTSAGPRTKVRQCRDETKLYLNACFLNTLRLHDTFYLLQLLLLGVPMPTWIHIYSDLAAAAFTRLAYSTLMAFHLLILTLHILCNAFVTQVDNLLSL